MVSEAEPGDILHDHERLSISPACTRPFSCCVNFTSKFQNRQHQILFIRRWRNQYGANGATAPADCQGTLLQIVQMR